MLRQNLFDIEVYSPKEFPLPEKAEHPINSITFYDNYSDSYISIIIDPSRAGQVKKEGNWTIYYVKDERTLMIFSAKLIRFFQPDVFGGWYSDQFDVPYFFNRYNNLEMKNVLYSISPLNSVNIRGKSISGIHLTDLIVLDKKLKKRTSYTLGDVAIEEKLPVQKTEKHEDIHEIYKTDKDRFVFYNKSDVGVLAELDKKNKMIDFFEGIRTFAGLNDLSEALQNSVLIDTVALRKALKEGFILPSKPERLYDTEGEDDEDEDSLGGGLVRTPSPGIHRNIIVLDMAKFYPKIIDLLNLSPETIIEFGLTKEQADNYRNKTNDIFVEYDEGKYARISTTKKGFIPSLIQEFLEQRLAIEKELKKLTPGTPEHTALSQKRDVAKFALNAIFGWTGYKKSRLYNPIVANSITFTGRKMISWTADKLALLMLAVIYGDTDSVHVELDEKILMEDVVKRGIELSESLSNDYISVVEKEYNIKCTSAFEIDFEKSFKSIIYIKKDDGNPAKKRYAARCAYEKGKYVDYLYVRGFDMRRSDASNYCKTLQEQLLKLILWDKPKEEIIKYVQDMITGFKKASISDIAIPKGINKKLDDYGKIKKDGKKGSIPAQIKGAIYSNSHLGTNFTTGSKIKYIYVKKMPNGYPQTPIISFDDENKLPKGIVFDMQKMEEDNIKNKIERILSAAGIPWNDVQGQKSLFEF